VSDQKSGAAFSHPKSRPPMNDVEGCLPSGTPLVSRPYPMITLPEAALEYAQRGYPIFPCHSRAPDAQCTCGRSACSGNSRAKHPRTARGLHDATTEIVQVRAWWSQWPDANIGLNLGLAGLVVIDCDQHDPERDGVANFKALLAELGLADLQTARVMTGGGGQHWYFRAPGVKLVGTLGLGIDVKQAGGYVILPPSQHISGTRYAWT